MSVALARMEAVFNLQLNLASDDCTHNLHRFHQRHHHKHPCYQRLPSPSVGCGLNNQKIHHDSDGTLRFSIINILRPDFGRKAIIKTKTPCNRSSSSSTEISSSILQLPHCTNLVIPSNSTSPLQRHSTALSRSGSLESLASNRSSITTCSLNGSPSSSSFSSSLSSSSSSSSTSSINGNESVNGDNNIVADLESTVGAQSSPQTANEAKKTSLWPAWVYCTRYSDRPSSGPRTRRVKRSSNTEKSSSSEDKRPRTAFSGEQLARLKREFTENRYLTERRRQQLSKDLGLNEAQIKIWFQNKRAKIKKSTGEKNPLALQLMAQGLYNHSTVPVDDNGEEILESGNKANL